MRLQGVTPERPLTHDLFASTLEELGVTVKQIVVSDLSDETYRARLVLELGRRDAWTSTPGRRDAIALAIRVGVPIFATDAVLDRAGRDPGARRGGEACRSSASSSTRSSRPARGAEGGRRPD